MSQLWLDWFIGLVPHDLFLRGRGYSDWTPRDNTLLHLLYTSYHWRSWIARHWLKQALYNRRWNLWPSQKNPYYSFFPSTIIWQILCVTSKSRKKSFGLEYGRLWTFPEAALVVLWIQSNNQGKKNGGRHIYIDHPRGRCDSVPFPWGRLRPVGGTAFAPYPRLWGMLFNQV